MTEAPAARRWLRESRTPLTESYDAGLLDLDGVVYVGADAVAEAPAAIAAARSGGMRIVFVTNNASRTPGAVAAQLVGLGVSATVDDVATAAQAAARLIASRVPSGSPVLVVGGEGLRVALEERDLKPVFSADDAPVAVVQGYAPDLTYAHLAEGAIAVRRGALFVASNLDVTLPSARGPLPGNGALVEVLRQATGVTPVSAGKPELPLHEEAVRRAGARRPLIVGDRLGTDIAGAVRAGTDSLFVLTGVTDPSGLLAAGEDRRPTYLASDLTGLGRSHPAVTEGPTGWSCGGWTAVLDGDELGLVGAGGYDDGLRALCAAAWTARRPVASDAALATVASAGNRL